MQWLLGTILIVVVFGLIGLIFAGYTHLAVRLMMTSTRPEPTQIGEIVAAIMTLATALTCGITCILRLPGRPVARWALRSIGLAVVTVIGIMIWRPQYFTVF
jgi:hypothetical protein